MANTPLHPQKLIEIGKWVDYRDPIWGDSYNWSWNRPTHQIEWIVYHHTVTSKQATPDDIALLHKARGWGGVGYHLIIAWDGTVYYVGDVGTARANVLNKNEKVIGIAMVGDFTQHNPSDAQIISGHHLGEFFLQAAAWPQLKTWHGSVKGHKELQATACPGTYWRDVPGVPDTLYERLKNKIPYTPIPDPTPSPPPDVITPDDPCAEWKNKYNQSLRVSAELQTTLDRTEASLKTEKQTNINLLSEIDKLTNEVNKYDYRNKSGAELIGLGFGKLLNPKGGD